MNQSAMQSYGQRVRVLHKGRVQRSEITPIIYDYRDIKIDYLDRMFLKRNIHYRKLEMQRTRWIQNKVFNEEYRFYCFKNTIQYLQLYFWKHLSKEFFV